MSNISFFRYRTIITLAGKAVVCQESNIDCLAMLAAVNISPVSVDSVVGGAYEQIRGMIVAGDDLPPGARLAQGDLAEMLQISRTSVREALRQLAGDGLVRFQMNRGFFVGDVGVEGVLRRLEVRLLLEPGIAALAVDRLRESDVRAMRAAIGDERDAATPEDAHDASREFHMALARATQNEEAFRVMDSLWIADLSRRRQVEQIIAPQWPMWKESDSSEHAGILDAIVAKDRGQAKALVREHVQAALRSWRRTL